MRVDVLFKSKADYARFAEQTRRLKWAADRIYALTVLGADSPRDYAQRLHVNVDEAKLALASIDELGWVLREDVEPKGWFLGLPSRRREGA